MRPRLPRRAECRGGNLPTQKRRYVERSILDALSCRARLPRRAECRGGNLPTQKRCYVERSILDALSCRARLPRRAYDQKIHITIDKGAPI